MENTSKKTKSQSKNNLRKISKTVNIVLFVILVVVLGFGAYKFAYSIANDSAVDKQPGRDVKVVIEQGMSVSSVGKMLEDKGLINNKYQFIVTFKLNKQSDKIYAGEYILNTSQNISEMLSIIRSKGEQKKNE